MNTLPKGFLLGSYVPLVTPFHDGEVDYDAYAALVDFQAKGGSHGVVVTGTSGEPSMLTPPERVERVRVAVEAAAGRVPVVAATGSQALPETLELTAAAERAGAVAVLVVTPYYVKPPQQGLISYFGAVADHTSLPVLIYHIPGRSAVSMAVESVARIVDGHPNVVGMKHASEDLGYVTELLARLGDGFRVYAGLEEAGFPLLAIGGSGVMSAVGNLAPAQVARLCEAVREGRLEEGRALHYKLFELNRAVFWDTNPIPVKYLMRRLGLLKANEHRLPMRPATPDLERRLDDLVERLDWLFGAGSS